MWLVGVTHAALQRTSVGLVVGRAFASEPPSPSRLARATVRRFRCSQTPCTLCPPRSVVMNTRRACPEPIALSPDASQLSRDLHPSSPSRISVCPTIRATTVEASSSRVGARLLPVILGDCTPRAADRRHACCARYNVSRSCTGMTCTFASEPVTLPSSRVAIV